MRACTRTRNTFEPRLGRGFDARCGAVRLSDSAPGSPLRTVVATKYLRTLHTTAHTKGRIEENSHTVIGAPQRTLSKATPRAPVNKEGSSRETSKLGWPATGQRRTILTLLAHECDVERLTSLGLCARLLTAHCRTFILVTALQDNIIPTW